MKDLKIRRAGASVLSRKKVIKMRVNRAMQIAVVATWTGLLTACATPQQPVPPDYITGPISSGDLTSAHASRYPVFAFSTATTPLDAVPIGTIVAFRPFRSMQLPETWQYCDGSLITDPQSPAYGQRVPDLTDDRFLIGSAKSFGLSAGDNNLSRDGGHDHSAVTGSAGAHDHGELTDGPDVNARLLGSRGSQVRIYDRAHRHKVNEQPHHSHTIGQDGAHDHGGDKRPRHFGVLYIIKIK